MSSESKEEERKAKQRAYYQANKEKIKAKRDNARKEELLAKEKERKIKEEKYKAHKKAYREANKERLKAYDKAYKEANKEKINEQKRKNYRKMMTTLDQKS
jgi:hypothetical protein